MSRNGDRRRPLRIATVGFQGFGNIGDEAILTGIEAALASSPVEVTTVFSGPRPDSIEAFPAARRIVAWRHLPGREAVRSLRRVDLLLLAGGGIFNDHWTAVVPRYAAWVFAARIAGARVAWVGVGVGPIRRRWLRWLTRLAARASTLVLVRDQASAGLLAARGTRVIADPSLFNAPPHPIPRTAELALIVRAPARIDAERGTELVDAIVATARSAEAGGLHPVIFTMAGEADRPFARQVGAALERAGIRGVASEALGPTPSAALARLASVEAIVTVRLHGLLLGALADVPAVAIAYDDKVRAGADRLGMGQLAVALAGLSGDNLNERLAAARTDASRAVVRERVATLRAERDDLAEAVVAVRRRR